MEPEQPTTTPELRHVHKETSSHDRSSTSSLWHVLGRRVPRSEIVFGCQMVLIYMVVGTSIYNLSTGQGDSNLWTALLSSCLGYVLPNPSLKAPVL